MSLRPLGVLVGGLTDILVIRERFWRDWSHHICEDQLEDFLGLAIGRLEVSQLVALPTE